MGGSQLVPGTRHVYTYELPRNTRGGGGAADWSFHDLARISENIS